MGHRLMARRGKGLGQIGCSFLRDAAGHIMRAHDDAPVISRPRASYRKKRKSPRVSETAYRPGRIATRSASGTGGVAIYQDSTGTMLRASRRASPGTISPV